MSDEGQRHHYIPVCYLKQWLNEKNQICQYSKPYENRVIPTRLHPSATGYVRGLYDFSGIEDREVRETLEREFMRPVDTRAAELLVEMTSGEQTMNNSEKRSAWITFLLSLLMRIPDDIRLHKERYLADWYKTDPKRRRYYKKIWRPGLPNRVEEVVARHDPQEIEWRALDVLVPLMTNPSVGEFIYRMQWGVITIPKLAPVLLTSDRPIIMSDGLLDKYAYILMPISPKHVFYAVNDYSLVNSIMRQGELPFISMINKSVTRQAVKYVYAQWDIHLDYVQEHMGTGQLPSLIERMKNTAAARKGHRRLQRLRRKGLLP